MRSSMASSRYINPVFLLLTVLCSLALLRTQYLSSIFTSLTDKLCRLDAAAINNNPTIPTPPQSEISTTPAKMAASAKLSFDTLLPIITNRRSVYALTKQLPISKARIQHLVNETTLHTPSSFNVQSNRLVVLFDKEHDKFWDITRDALKPLVPAENWQATADRVAGFQGAAGTILFFHDEPSIKALEEQMPLYAINFAPWALQSLGIQQWLLWAGLEGEGLGANLQHYSPLVEADVKKTWGVPEGWKLNAQLVFGGLKGGPLKEKTFKPVEETVKYFGLEE